MVPQVHTQRHMPKALGLPPTGKIWESIVQASCLILTQPPMHHALNSRHGAAAHSYTRYGCAAPSALFRHLIVIHLPNAQEVRNVCAAGRSGDCLSPSRPSTIPSLATSRRLLEPCYLLALTSPVVSPVGCTLLV